MHYSIRTAFHLTVESFEAFSLPSIFSASIFRRQQSLSEAILKIIKRTSLIWFIFISYITRRATFVLFYIFCALALAADQFTWIGNVAITKGDEIMKYHLSDATNNLSLDIIQITPIGLISIFSLFHSNMMNTIKDIYVFIT